MNHSLRLNVVQCLKSASGFPVLRLFFGLCLYSLTIQPSHAQTVTSVSVMTPLALSNKSLVSSGDEDVIFVSELKENLTLSLSQHPYPLVHSLAGIPPKQENAIQIEELETVEIAPLSGISSPAEILTYHRDLLSSSFSQTPQIAQARPRQGDEPPSLSPIPEPEPRQLPPLEDLLPVPTPSPLETTPGDVPGTITVNRFEVVGSSVFSEKEFDQLLAEYTNRPLTFAELLEARSAVTDFYVRQGYITSGAVIPPQELEDGVVTIEVIEGGLEDINVTVDGHLKPSYVRSRLEQATQTPLNVEKLREMLQLLQLDPIIESLSAELSAGPRAGLSLLDVRVESADTFDLGFLVDNGRSPSVGTVRRRVFVEDANLVGLGDRAFASYTNTEGSDAFDFSYAIPVNPMNGTVRFAYGTTDSEVVEDPFTPLDIQSDSRYYEISLRQPVLLTPTQEFAVGITASRQESENFLLGIPFPLSTGANDEGETRVSAFRFFQEWTQRGENQVFAARSQFSLGVDLLGATINEDAPDSRFFSWRGQAQWVRLLAEDTLLLLRTDVQLANQALVPLEQFGLGGIESVRGYRQDVLLSDNGILASAEARVPIWRIEKWDSLLQVTPFIDFGTAWNSEQDNADRPDPDPSTILGLGFGLRWQTGDNLTARLDWGIPIIDVETTGDSLQEDGIYFSITYIP